MGYLTKYNLVASKEQIQQLRETYDSANFALSEYGDSREDAKWYEHENHLKEFSKLHPEVVFELQGKGEESGDLWIKYFKNGKMQVCHATVTYEPFNENMLK